MTATATARKFIDCREYPSENNCSLKIAGTEQEVLTVARHHAVTAHGHTDGPELETMLRSGLREERAT